MLTEIHRKSRCQQNHAKSHDTIYTQPDIGGTQMHVVFYAVTNVIQFVADRRLLVGDDAPHIVARAIELALRADRIDFVTEEVAALIMEDEMYARMFDSVVRTEMVHHDLRRRALYGGTRVNVPLRPLFIALFGDAIPDEFAQILRTERLPETFGGDLCLEMNSRGIRWEASWFSPPYQPASRIPRHA